MWNGAVYLMGHTPTTLCSHCLLWNQKVQLAQGFVPVDMNITFSNLRQKLACLSQNISCLLFRWDLYFLERFMYTGVHQCIFIRRSVTDTHLELCPLGYYCIKIKYWTMDFLLKKIIKKCKGKKINGIKVEIFLTMSVLYFLDIFYFFLRKCNSVWSVQKRCLKESLQIGSAFIYTHFTLTHYISSWGSPGYT